MGIAADERRHLSELFSQVGPDAPTLCGDWTTRELAAHLVVRERRIDAAPGILVKQLAGYLEHVQDGFATKPWPELVDLVRSGPAWFWPTRIPKIDEMVNVAEFFVHHEDVRRAQPDWAPREPDAHRDAVLWALVRRMGKALVRNSPVGVEFRTPAGKHTTLKGGPDSVTVTGEPGELVLFAYGRDSVARVSFEGDPGAVAKLQAAPRGI